MRSISELQEALDTHKMVKVIFLTKVFRTRKMICTRIPDDVNADKTYAMEHPDIINVYDYRPRAWRAFRKDSVISWSVV